MTRIEEIKARLEKATPGPWIWRTPGYLCNKYIENGLVIPDHAEVSDHISEENKTFIAHAPEDITFLLKEIDQLKRQLAERDKEIDRLRNVIGNVRCADDVDSEITNINRILRTRIEDAEKALKFYIRCDEEPECLASLPDDEPCGKSARDYFAKHPPDSAGRAKKDLESFMEELPKKPLNNPDNT